MSSKLGMIGSLVVCGVLASIGTAHAVQINTSGVVCQNFNAGEALDIDYLTIGARNINANSRFVICALPRTPSAAGTAASFFIDGENFGGTSTSCTVTDYTFFGQFVQSSSFTGVGTWDQLVSFAANVGTFDYFSVLCLLPGSGNGIVLGVTANP